MKKIKLVKVIRSPKSGKKYRAVFMRSTDSGGEREKNVDFGQAGASDYTKHKDKERRDRYIARHMKDLKTGDPSRAGFLSLFILWNKPTLEESLADYKRRLGTYNRTGKFPTNIVGYKSSSKNKSKRKSPKKKSRKRS